MKEIKKRKKKMKEIKERKKELQKIIMLHIFMYVFMVREEVYLGEN